MFVSPLQGYANRTAAALAANQSVSPIKNPFAQEGKKSEASKAPAGDAQTSAAMAHQTGAQQQAALIAAAIKRQPAGAPKKPAPPPASLPGTNPTGAGKIYQAQWQSLLM